MDAKPRVPAGWSLGTALPRGGSSGDHVQFATVSLTTLIDSPVLAGHHFRTVELGGTPPVYWHLAADGDAALGISDRQIMSFPKLLQEAGVLFGATHYNEYHFLWSLSDTIGFDGIEHHQSSDDRSPERSLTDEELRHSGRIATLRPHEYSKELLDDALTAGGDDPRIIKLLMQKDDSFLTLDARYAGHSRSPHLERDTAAADLLTPILSARTPYVPARLLVRRSCRRSARAAAFISA